MDKYTALIEKYRGIIDDLSEQYNEMIAKRKNLEMSEGYFDENNKLLEKKIKEKETLESDICMHVNKLYDLKKFKKMNKKEYDEFCENAIMPVAFLYLFGWFLFIALNYVTNFGWVIIMCIPTIYVFIKVLNKITIPYFSFKKRKKENINIIETLNDDINEITK